MSNEIGQPMIWQTRVGELRNALAALPADLPVGVRIPPGVGSGELTVVANVYLRPYGGEPSVILEVGKPPEAGRADDV